jgi:hypothetical protein
VAVSQTEVQVNLTCDAGTESGFRIYKDGSLARTIGANETDGTVTGLSAGNTYSFTAEAYNAYTTSAISNTVTLYLGNVFVDSVSDTVTVTDTVANNVAFTDSCSDSVSLSDDQTNSLGMVETVSDTVTLSDSTGESQTLRTAFDYYWGTSDGYVHRTAKDLLSDNGLAITSTWTSKTVDFAEASSENTGKWKTIYQIEHLYKEDDTLVSTTYSISNDGGATWTSKTKYVGTSGDGRTEHAHFHWNKTGQFFVIRVVWSSTDKEFQFLGFDVIYEPGAEQFEVV